MKGLIGILGLGGIITAALVMFVATEQGGTNSNDDGILRSVADFARGVDDELGSAVSDVGGFISQVPLRVGLASEDLDGVFVPVSDGHATAPSGTRAEPPFDAVTMAALIQISTGLSFDQASFPAEPPPGSAVAAGTPAAAKQQGPPNRPDRETVCEETGSDQTDVTLTLPTPGAGAHTDKGDAAGACE